MQQYHAGPQQQQAAPAQPLPPQYQYSAQRKPAPQTVSRPVILQQAQPQPQQYLREQPAQIKYVPRPVQYRQQQQQQEEEKEQDDYDVSVISFCKSAYVIISNLVRVNGSIFEP